MAARGGARRRGAKVGRRRVATFGQRLIADGVRGRHARRRRSGRGGRSARRRAAPGRCGHRSLLSGAGRVGGRLAAPAPAAAARGPLALKRLAADLNGIFCAAGQAGRNLAPLVAEPGLCLNYDLVLLLAVGTLVDGRVQVVAPALAALFGSPSCLGRISHTANTGHVVETAQQKYAEMLANTYKNGTKTAVHATTS